MKRAFIATIEIENVIVVDDSDPDWEAKAQELAVRAFKESDGPYPGDFDVEPMRHMPAGWTGGCLVWHDGPGDIRADEAAKLPGGYDHKGT